MKKLIRLTLLTSIAALSACGGGSDSEAPAKVAGNTDSTPEVVAPSASAPVTAVDPADKYVGTWKSECVNISAGSQLSSSILTLVVEKKSASVLNYKQAASVFTFFESTDCSGPAIKTEPALKADIGDIQISGTQVANGKDADRIIISYKNATWKDLAFTANGKLYFGATGSDDPLNDEGYPVNLKLSAVLTKQ